MARRRTATRAMVRYSPPVQRTTTVVVAPRRSMARRTGAYLRARSAGLLSSSRLRRSAGLVAGGGIAQLLVPAASAVLGTAQRGALATGLLGYVIGGDGTFVGSVGDGLLAAAGGAWAGDLISRLFSFPGSARGVGPTGGPAIAPQP